MDAAACESPYQIRIDSAKGEVTCFRGRARAGDIVEDPGELCRGEIGVEAQPCLLDNFILSPRLLKFAALVGSATVLPDDGVVDGDTAAAIPEQSGFALVGDTD